jgi:hypothetical protein
LVPAQTRIGLKLLIPEPDFFHPFCPTQDENQSSSVCRHIVWAIVCDGRYFFSKVKLCRDLKHGVWDDPPKSIFDLSIDRVIYANIINRPNYPKEWTEQVRQAVQPQGHYARATLPPSAQPQQASQPAAATGSRQRMPYIHPLESRHGLIKTLVDPVIAKFGPKFAVKTSRSGLRLFLPRTDRQ